MEQLFLLFSTSILISGIMVITSINPIHSVFWLTLTFILSASLFITIKIDFIALMLIIVYVGAIAILFLFVIMMIDVLKFKESIDINNLLPIPIIVSVSFFFNIWLLNKDQIFNLSGLYSIMDWNFDYLTNIKNVGHVMYTDYWLPFLLASFVLLIAMVGAIVLTHELGKDTKRQGSYLQQSRNNSWI